MRPTCSDGFRPFDFTCYVPGSRRVVGACAVLVGCICGLIVTAVVGSSLSWVPRGHFARGRIVVVDFRVGVVGIRCAPARFLLLVRIFRHRPAPIRNFSLVPLVRVWVP